MRDLDKLVEAKPSYMTQYRAIKIGSWMRSGKQEAKGLTLLLRYNSIVAWANFCCSPAYCFLQRFQFWLKFLQRSLGFDRSGGQRINAKRNNIVTTIMTTPTSWPGKILYKPTNILNNGWYKITLKKSRKHKLFYSSLDSSDSTACSSALTAAASVPRSFRFIFQPVNSLAKRTFCPLRPMAKKIDPEETETSAVLSVSLSSTEETFAGDKALEI